MQKYSMSWLDKIVLWRWKVLEANRIAENAVIFLCKEREAGSAVVKFSYLGNIQYHPIKSYDLDKFILAFQKAKTKK